MEAMVAPNWKALAAFVRAGAGESDLSGGKPSCDWQRFCLYRNAAALESGVSMVSVGASLSEQKRFDLA